MTLHARKDLAQGFFDDEGCSYAFSGTWGGTQRGTVWIRDAEGRTISGERIEENFAATKKKEDSE